MEIDALSSAQLGAIATAALAGLEAADLAALGTQQLRALIRQARKDGLPDKTAVSQGQFPRQGRAYRDIFKLVRDHLSAASHSDQP